MAAHHQGLSAASTVYVQGFSERSGIPVTLTTTPELKRLPFELELGLFRILQESLTNIHRHARTSSVDIQLKHGADHVTLQVKDYGLGKSAEMLEQFRTNGTGGGVGLLSMRERISELERPIRNSIRQEWNLDWSYRSLARFGEEIRGREFQGLPPDNRAGKDDGGLLCPAY